MGDQPDLDVSADDLTRLAGELGDMQDHLDSQVRRMDALVDTLRAGWRSTAATAYEDLHRGVAKDAVRVREMLAVIEEGVRLSRDGFTQRELDTLRRMTQERSEVDLDAEAGKLLGGDTPARSRILDV